MLNLSARNPSNIGAIAAPDHLTKLYDADDTDLEKGDNDIAFDVRIALFNPHGMPDNIMKKSLS